MKHAVPDDPQPHIDALESALAALDPPPPAPLDEDRIAGPLLGLAIGDALGNTSEAMNPKERRERFGEVRDYQRNRRLKGADKGRRIGLPSDDTQLTFRTIESYLDKGNIDPADLMLRFAEEPIYGIGQALRAALDAHKSGEPWTRTGQDSAGNGALMRIAPIALIHARSPGPDLWRDGLRATLATHRDPLALAASAAFLGLLTEALALTAAPDPAWWLDAFLRYARPIDPARIYTPRRQGLAFSGGLVAIAEELVRPALKSKAPTRELCDAWHSGAYLLETLPCVLLILARHGRDPEEAIIRAVNDTRDNDTCAAIVGAAVGALHGRDALPRRWIDKLSGRTRAFDDGRVFELIAAFTKRLIGA